MRCHDDIGWAITEEDAAAVGETGFEHRRFLVDFYAGDFPGSFARGARFQENEATGDARTSGTAASLAGLEARRRARGRSALLLLYAVAFAYGGLPLIYMGDELGLVNDRDWARRPGARERQPLDAPAADGLGGRGAAARPGHVEGRLWAGLQRLIEQRRGTRAVHAQGTIEAIWTGNDHVFGLRREHAGDRLLLLANFSPEPQTRRAGRAPSASSSPTRTPGWSDARRRARRR